MTDDELKWLDHAASRLERSTDGYDCVTARHLRALESRVLAERKQEPVAQIIRRKTYSGLDVWDIKIFDKDMQHGTKLYATPPAQSAEQDRIEQLEAQIRVLEMKVTTRDTALRIWIERAERGEV